MITESYPSLFVYICIPKKWSFASPFLRPNSPVSLFRPFASNKNPSVVNYYGVSTPAHDSFRLLANLRPHLLLRSLGALIPSAAERAGTQGRRNPIRADSGRWGTAGNAPWRSSTTPPRGSRDRRHVKLPPFPALDHDPAFASVISWICFGPCLSWRNDLFALWFFSCSVLDVICVCIQLEWKFGFLYIDIMFLVGERLILFAY